MIVKRTDTALFCIGPDKDKFSNGTEFYYIPDYTYDYVYNVCSNFEKRVKLLLNKEGDVPGTRVYWEENYHDKIAKFLHMMNPKHNYNDISNSLNAIFGY